MPRKAGCVASQGSWKRSVLTMLVCGRQSSRVIAGRTPMTVENHCGAQLISSAVGRTLGVKRRARMRRPWTRCDACRRTGELSSLLVALPSLDRPPSELGSRPAASRSGSTAGTSVGLLAAALAKSVSAMGRAQVSRRCRLHSQMQQATQQRLWGLAEQASSRVTSIVGPRGAIAAAAGVKPPRFALTRWARVAEQIDLRSSTSDAALQLSLVAAHREASRTPSRTPWRSRARHRPRVDDAHAARYDAPGASTSSRTLRDD